MFGIVGKKHYLCSVINKATICKTKSHTQQGKNISGEGITPEQIKKSDERYGIGVTKLLFWEGGDKTRTFLKKLKSVNFSLRTKVWGVIQSYEFFGTFPNKKC